MKYILISFGGLIISFVILIVVLNIINYKKSKRAYIEDINFRRISSVKMYETLNLINDIAKTYDFTVYRNISLKVKYIGYQIQRFPKNKQLELYDKLYKMVYETNERLKTDYNDVVGIVSPLDNLLKEIEKTQS